ncbi:MAG: hypothetical protein HYZ00_10990, partial [Candidatus Hydrogenedentes bacterium]|nr:hypothetical protein [Candidatus Hydrogenedentota bacterium]
PPLRETAAYRLTWGVEGNLQGEFSRGEERVPWVADWQAQLAEEGESWSFEIAMPLPQFGILSAMDGAISPMRLNLQVSDAAQKGGQPLIGWGFPVLEEVEHGLLLVP